MNARTRYCPDRRTGRWVFWQTLWQQQMATAPDQDPKLDERAANFCDDSPFISWRWANFSRQMATVLLATGFSRRTVFIVGLYNPSPQVNIIWINLWPFLSRRLSHRSYCLIEKRCRYDLAHLIGSKVYNDAFSVHNARENIHFARGGVWHRLNIFHFLKTSTMQWLLV